jgi:hypothetical protein
MGIWSKNVGVKFNEDGSPREFLGNTFICHVPKDSPVFAFLLKMITLLQQQPWAKKYCILPPSSFHVTVFEGVRVDRRKLPYWSAKLPLDAPLEQVDQFLLDIWPSLPKPDGFSLQWKYLEIDDTIGINLQPVSEDMEQKMRHYRDLLAEKTGIRTRNHNRYGFHITFAYLIQRLTIKELFQSLRWDFCFNAQFKKEFGILQLNTPELCFYADMTNFANSRKEIIRNCQN